MKREIEGKWKTAGIVTVAMLVISVLFAVMPASAADSVRVGPPSSMTTIYQGEKINITGVNSSYNVKFYRIEDSNEVYKFEVIPYTVKRVTADIAPSGHYHIKYVPAGKTNWTTSETDIVSPSMEIELLDAYGKEITATTKGKKIYIDTSMLNIPLEDVVEIKHKPEGGSETTITKIDIKNLTNYPIDTSSWKIGEHELWIETVPELSYGLDMKSDTVTIKIYEEEISIEAEKTQPFTYEEVRIRIRAPPYTLFNFSTNYPENVIMTSAEDNPLNLSIGEETNMTNLSNPKIIKYNGRYGFNATTDESGEYAFVVKFTDDRTYTFKVWFGYDSYDDATGKYRDKVDIDVSKARISFDVPATVVRGETLTIRGTAPEAKWVVIAVDDKVIEGGEHVTVTNGKFEVDWDTSNYVPGTYTIEGFIELEGYKAGDSVKGISSDGRVTIRIIPPAPELHASISKSIVSLGESFEVYGNASTDYVEVVAISPEGGSGIGLDGLYGVSIYTVPIFKFYNFYKKIKVDCDADTGNYTIIVLSPGMDGVYGMSPSYKYIDSILDLDGAGPELGVIDVSNKTQEEIVRVIEDATVNAAGSDDLIWMGNIIVSNDSYIDTGQSPNPYPSIFGTHNGTIVPANDITVSKIFVYPCVGTGGHAEYVRIWGNGVDAHATWNGYGGEDWNILHFNRTFTLEAGKEYNFTIKTGSYPQIFHEELLETLDGSIVRCEEFVDVNGKRHKWIPAFKIYA